MPKTNSEKPTQFLNGYCASPNVLEFYQVVDDNNLATWDHLTILKVSQHIRDPTTASLGHVDHQRKNKLPTKKIDQFTDDLKEDAKPEPDSTKSIKVHVITHKTMHRMITDQTGKFPTKSIRGRQCIMITHVCDTNSIPHRLLRTKLAQESQ